MPNENQESSRILIYRDTGKPGMGVAAKLRKLAKGGNVTMATATDTRSLRRKLEEQAVQAVVIDVGREAGATLAALRILKGFPAIPLFVFNGFLLPRIEEKVREYGHYYLENRIHLDETISLILATAQRRKSAIGQGISLPSFLQLMDIEKWSGLVTVAAGEEKGILLLHAGRLLSATVADLKGRAAWERMAAWENITVETHAGRPSDSLSAADPRPEDLNPIKTSYSDPRPERELSGAGNIEILHLIRPESRIALNLKKLSLGVAAAREMLSTSLVRTDIFLSENSRSLAGWNSSPLACSTFAAITKSLKNALQLSRFPALGAYYLLDLADDQLVFIVVRDELQWGFLLQGMKDRLGLLLNIVLPRVMKTIDESLAVEYAS